MSNALLSSVSSALNLSARQEIAKILGEPEPVVSKGLELVGKKLVEQGTTRNSPLRNREAGRSFGNPPRRTCGSRSPCRDRSFLCAGHSMV
jgi:hypothetical protein